MQAREELDHAIAAVKTLYTNSLLEERAETGADVTPLARFRIAGKAVSQLVRLSSSPPATAYRYLIDGWGIACIPVHRRLAS